MEKYYISSSKYTIESRETKKNGVLYDIRFRVMETDTYRTVHKRLSGYKTKTAAREAYMDFVTKNCTLLKNADAVLKPDKQKEDPRIADLFSVYTTAIASQNKPGSIVDKKTAFRTHILPDFGNMTVPQITKESFYRWQDKLFSGNSKRGLPISYDTAKKVASHFKSFLTWCETRYGYANVAKDIKRPKRTTPKRTMHFWTRDQFETFIAVVDDPVYRCLFTLLFFTGMRISEALALSPSDIRDGSISISKSLTTQTNGNGKWMIVPTKAYKNHIVPLCEPAQKAIRQYMEIAGMPLSQFTPHEIQDFGEKTGNHSAKKQKANKGHCRVPEMAYMKAETVKKGSKEISENTQTFFFGGPYPCSADSVRYRFNCYVEKSGVPKIRIHDLRHSFVSMLIHFGASFLVVSDLIGDNVDQVAKTYAHLYKTDRDSIIAQIR